MATYIVLKRMKEDRTYMPGEYVDDEVDNLPRVQLLIARGYILPAVGPAADNSNRPPTVEEAMQAGYSEKAAKALSEGRTPKYVEEETAKIEAARAEADAKAEARPEAEELAKAMEDTVEGVMSLSDGDYAAAVQAFITNAETAEESSTSGPDQDTPENKSFSIGSAPSLPEGK